MVSRKKRIFLAIALMFELIFLATHWNDYVFTPMNPDEVMTVNLHILWDVVDNTDFYAAIQKSESVHAIIEIEDFIRKNDNVYTAIKAWPYSITLSYVLNTGETVTRFYRMQVKRSELEQALLQIDEVRAAMK